MKGAGKLKKKRDAAIRDLVALRDGKKLVEYKQDEAQGKRQCSQCKCKERADAVNRLQSDVGVLQEFVVKEPSALQKRIDAHWVRVF